MKVKLAYKLFLMFVITGMASMILMMGFMRYFFREELRNFVVNWEVDRFQDFAGKLGDAYKVHGNWEDVKHSPLAFRDMLFPDITEEQSLKGKPGASGQVVVPPSPNEELYYPAIRRRVTLYDANRHVVAGWSASRYEQIMKPIVVNGQTVGWLGLIKRKNETTRLEDNFLYRQTMIFFIVGCSVFSLSVLISILLSRNILRPVDRLARGASAMASRKFDTRIEVKTSDELGRLAEDFNRMAQTLERYETLRKQFISDISHDLRTPLSILKGEIEAMQDGVREMSGRNLESLSTEVMHLEKLANDLHDLAVVDAGGSAATLEPVDVIEVLIGEIGVFTPVFAQESIALTCEPGTGPRLTVMGERHRLAQVFSNLLENSLRYTSPPGELRVSWALEESDLRIRFEDTKPGVPDESLDRLFERLYRIDPSRSRKYIGSGLGLAICKGIVESLKGRIKADHSTLGGLMIEIVLPVQKQA